MNLTLKIIAASVAIYFSCLSNSYAHGDKESDSHTASAQRSEIGAQHIIRIESGFRIEGPSVIKLKRGDQVEIDFLADSADELHLHGYDITLVLIPNEISRLSFKAKYAGRFGFELHDIDREIGAFEIQP
jgi:hypothetical protein